MKSQDSKRDDGLVLVKSFDELKTGMRVVCHCGWCGKNESHVLGDMARGRTVGPAGDVRYEKSYALIYACRSGVSACGERDVENRRVFRFASDLGIDAQLSAEANPYVTDHPFVNDEALAAAAKAWGEAFEGMGRR